MVAVFLIDGSNSVGGTNYRAVRTFVLGVSSLMPMPPVAAGAVQFACANCLDYIDLSNYYNNAAWASTMGVWPYMSRSGTGEGLDGIMRTAALRMQFALVRLQPFTAGASRSA